MIIAETTNTPGREARVDIGGVAVTMRAETRLCHASDTTSDRGVVFGGDAMGHWNVDRINRILDALNAPVRQLAIPLDAMQAMAKVGAPDSRRVMSYAQRGLASMPPLSFVALEEPTVNAAGTIRTMLVDGHHRLMALFLLDAPTVPARILPSELEADVRVIEIAQVAVFPERALPTKEVELGRWQA